MLHNFKTNVFDFDCTKFVVILKAKTQRADVKPWQPKFCI
jgi:hypothetical protein